MSHCDAGCAADNSTGRMLKDRCVRGGITPSLYTIILVQNIAQIEANTKNLTTQKNIGVAWIHPQTPDADSCNSRKGIERERRNNILFSIAINIMDWPQRSRIDSVYKNLLWDAGMLDCRRRAVSICNSKVSLD